MTNTHIHHYQGIITATWKEDYITPFWRKEIERIRFKKPNKNNNNKVSSHPY